MLLSFSVTNFRCFAETATLDLTTPRLKTVRPRAGQSWASVTERVATIFGPNASGKSTLLDSIAALATALRVPGHGSIHQPHRHGEQSVRYEADFVVDSVRYSYLVETAAWGVTEESLSAYPKGTRRVLFTRSQASPDSKLTVTKGPSLAGPTTEVSRVTRPGMLFLATAHRYGHEALTPVARGLMIGIGTSHLSFRDRQDQDVVKRVVMEMVAAPDLQTDLTRALVQTADLGIDHIEVRAEEIPEDVREQLKRVWVAVSEGDDVSEDDIPKVQDVLAFRHRGDDGQEFDLPLEAESAGTITWLTTAWHALNALRHGSLLLIDEIDASLHPDLVRYLVSLFLNPELNALGAQLVFTTHDVSLLGNAPTKLLEPGQVWFTEKDRTGRSELFSLADFDNRPGNNSERRYLAGQFGAVPEINDRLILRYIAPPNASEEPARA